MIDDACASALLCFERECFAEQRLPWGAVGVFTLPVTRHAMEKRWQVPSGVAQSLGHVPQFEGYPNSTSMAQCVSSRLEPW